MVSSSEAERTQQRAIQALERGDLTLAWHELSPLAADLEREPQLAALWLDLLRAGPQRPQLEAEAMRIISRWPSDAGLVTRACDALIRRAELGPPDEPSAERTRLAKAAAGAAERCLQELGDAASGHPLAPFLLASQGNALRLSGEHELALRCLQQAIEAEPERGGFWLNLGLLHKARHAFRDALLAFQRAEALLGEERGVLWNVAICATALGEGATAVAALSKLGHRAELAESGMPYVAGLPPASIRVATVGSGLVTTAVPDRSVGLEVLWVTPLSPCHGVVSSPSYREASADYGDLVLWDGIPVGMAEHEGRPVPRFPLLSVLRKGDEHRLRFVALQQSSGQVAALGEQLGQGALLFIHHERIERFCARCASGEHLRKHQHEPAEEHRLVQGKLVLPAAVDLPAFKRDLDGLLQRHSGVQLVVPRLFELVGDTAGAGVAHRLWRALTKPEPTGPGASPTH